MNSPVCADDRGKVYCEHYKNCKFRTGARTIPHVRRVNEQLEVSDFHFKDDDTMCGAYVRNDKPPLYAVIDRFPHLKEQFERMDGVNR